MNNYALQSEKTLVFFIDKQTVERWFHRKVVEKLFSSAESSSKPHT
jgi:hypothetical protein